AHASAWPSTRRFPVLLRLLALRRGLTLARRGRRTALLAAGGPRLTWGAAWCGAGLGVRLPRHGLHRRAGPDFLEALDHNLVARLDAAIDDVAILIDGADG